MYYPDWAYNQSKTENWFGESFIPRTAATTEWFKQADGDVQIGYPHKRMIITSKWVAQSQLSTFSGACLDFTLVLDIILPKEDLRPTPSVLNVYHLHVANINNNSTSVQILSARLLFCVQTARVQLCSPIQCQLTFWTFDIADRSPLFCAVILKT